ncbi:MAG: choice-of-anchor D domain-containing protein [Acidobacteriota bacterium]
MMNMLPRESYLELHRLPFIFPADTRKGRASRLPIVLAGLLAVFGSACGGSSSTSPTTTTTTTTPPNGPAVTFTPAILTFTTANSSVPQTVTLTNSGTADLVISSVVASGNFTETDNCVTTLAVGATCTITVTFVPLNTGSTGGVTITDNASTSPQTLSLAGPNVTSPADAFSPTSLTFATQRVGTASAPQTVTLSNPVNGLSAPLTISSIVTVGDFAIASNTCGGSLAAGTSCTIGVTFKPTAAGPVSGLLAVFDNAPNTQRGVTLSGTGQ